MDTWELEFEWLQVRHKIKDMFNKDALPDLNAVLFIIGIQEYGHLKESYTKEEKQDLMHIAICRLLSDEGYYSFEGIDAEGWPHWKLVKKVPVQGLKEQEELLKEKVIKYFKNQDTNEAT
jgi:hypothetical protein